MITEEIRKILLEEIECKYACKATFLQTVPVFDIFVGQPLIDGPVFVFTLEGHSRGIQAYAWIVPADGTDRPRIHAMLHCGNIRSPRDAVRAVMLPERRHARNRYRLTTGETSK